MCDCVSNVTNYNLLKELEKRITEGSLIKRQNNKYDENEELYTEISLQDNNVDNNVAIIVSRVY